MRAALLDTPSGIESIRIADISIDPPGPLDIQVAVRASSVNFPDILMAENAYQIKPPLPFTPGMEGAGTVAAVGRDVKKFKVGDRVLASVEFGTFAERVNVPADRCFAVPDAISFEDAAAVGLAYQTAYFALRERGQMKPDDVILINGSTGGVGLAAIRLAKACGAKTVIASVASLGKKSIVIEAGADAVVEIDTKDHITSLKDQVANATGGRLADLVIESVGGEIFEASLRALAFRGRLVVVGFASGTIPTVKANYILLKNISLTGLQWALYPSKMTDEVLQAQAEIFSLLASGQLKANIGATYELNNIRTALGDMKHRRVRGKIVVRI
jgi:NADPH2:quinone reductase